MSLHRNVLLAAMAVGLLAGCSHFKRSSEYPPIEEVSRGTPPEDGYRPSADYGKLDLPMNKYVERWLEYFTGRGRKYMETYLQRSSRYIPMMKGVFRERGMPDELAYIAMIESGFSATALSHASAVGYWQFIRATGKRYNLRIDSYVDERRDPILSTQAAATYLDSLYSLFGDWHLALAAYNSGENRVQRAVMKKRTRDFWELAAYRSRRVLPPETRNYVPKFVAAVYIAKDPAKYGFTDIDFHPEFEFDSVVIDKPVSLELLAKQLNVTYEELKKMNPRYKSDYVPVYSDRTNAVRVPVGRKNDTIAVLSKIYTDKPLHYVEGFEWYRVRRGDTLSEIAVRYRTSISYIRELNDMNRRRSFLRVGQRLKVPDGPRRPRRVARRSSSAKRSTASVGGRYHVVRRGDTLSGIAAHYGLSISQLRRWNGLRGRSLIRVGQRLRITPAGEASKKVARSRRKIHVVRRGENLTAIARRYHVPLARLTEANDINRRATLFVGKRLIIPD